MTSSNSPLTASGTTAQKVSSGRSQKPSPTATTPNGSVPSGDPSKCSETQPEAKGFNAAASSFDKEPFANQLIELHQLVESWPSRGDKHSAELQLVSWALEEASHHLNEMRETLHQLLRIFLPIDMQMGQIEMAGEPAPDDAILFSFMGSGASDHVTVGEYRKARSFALAALRELGAA